MFGRGGAAIAEPVGGELLAGPLYDKEGIVTADCDLDAALHAKRWFDVAGHYSREDVLLRPRERGRYLQSSNRSTARASRPYGSSSNSTSPTTTSSPRSNPAR